MDAPTALAEEKAAQLSAQAQRTVGNLEWRKLKRAWLMQLGVDEVAAAAFGDYVDWHEVEALVAAGCEPNLALEIASERSTGWTA